MRCFIAIAIPKEIKDKIGKFQEQIKKSNSVKAKFVDKNLLHLTIKFLGEVKDIDKIKEKCREIKGKEFRVSIKGIGAFPSKNYIRVLWIGVEKGSKELEALAKKLDNQKFSSHITIARVRRVNKARLKELFVDKEFGEFEVNEFKLIKSALTPKGPVYEVVEKFTL